MKTVKVQRTIFRADDGKEFIAEKECRDYEEKFLDLIKRIKYYRTSCSPDCTEGRGWHKTLYIAVLPEEYKNALYYGLEYLIQRFKTCLAYVQGCSMIEEFCIPTEITKELYDEARSGRIGDYPATVEKIFISQTKIDGFCEPVWIKGKK